MPVKLQPHQKRARPLAGESYLGVLVILMKTRQLQVWHKCATRSYRSINCLTIKSDSLRLSPAHSLQVRFETILD